VDLQRPGGDPVLSASPDVAICACRYGIIVTQLGDREEEARPCFSLPVAWSHTEIRVCLRPLSRAAGGAV